MTIEERVAQLEEQVAELAIQTAAGNSTGYYTSKYSGEQIDALLDKIK